MKASKLRLNLLCLIKLAQEHALLGFGCIKDRKAAVVRELSV